MEYSLPTQHGEMKTPVTVDIIEAGILCSFTLLAASFLIILIGVQGKQCGKIFLRVIVSLLIGLSILLGNFGQTWEIGCVSTDTPYKAGSSHIITADICLKIGLHAINITLKSDSGNMHLKNEIINYNERFSWTWDQGRLGFGPFAGKIQQEFRQAQHRGIPFPILWIGEYFIIDGEGLRFGRYYRTAGWYAHIALWSAFPCWVLANILFLSVIRIGAYFTILAGVLQILSCILWISIRNFHELDIPFSDHAKIVTHFSINFWQTLISGVFCFLLGIVITALDLRFPDELYSFFGADPLTEYEEHHLTLEEIKSCLKIENPGSDIEMETPNVIPGRNDSPLVPKTKVVLKRRSTIRRGQKGKYIPACISEEPEYMNMPANRSYNSTRHLNSSTDNLY